MGLTKYPIWGCVDMQYLHYHWNYKAGFYLGWGGGSEGGHSPTFRNFVPSHPWDSVYICKSLSETLLRDITSHLSHYHCATEQESRFSLNFEWQIVQTK